MDAVFRWLASPGRDAEPFQVPGSRSYSFFLLGWGPRGRCGLCTLFAGCFDVQAVVRGFAPAKPVVSGRWSGGRYAGTVLVTLSFCAMGGNAGGVEGGLCC
jgi:hypothetical protein